VGDAPNLQTLKRKMLSEIEVNNPLKALKYQRLDGENQTVAKLQMNNNEIVGLSNPVEPPERCKQKRSLKAAVNSVVQDMTAKNRIKIDQMILVTNKNVNSKVMFLDGTNQPTADIS